MTKDVKKKGEDAKVAIRNIRRDANDYIKKEQKANEISEDEQKDAEAEVQKLTDQFVKKIDEMVESKSKEIMTAHIVFLTAGGQRYTEEHAKRLAQYDNLTLVCGHYEGIDERVIEAFADEEISIGDYILTGGELASLVVADSVLRLKPGVLAEQKGYEEESYWDGLLEYPQYTRPEVWEGRAVPEVLLGGDHAKIDAWRGEQSRTRTRLRRPELYEQWCTSHPIAEVPKWKRGENVRLVKTAEQFAAAAKLFAEGRQAVCADNWTPEYCRALTEPQFLLQLQHAETDVFEHTVISMIPAMQLNKNAIPTPAKTLFIFTEIRSALNFLNEVIKYCFIATPIMIIKVN